MSQPSVKKNFLYNITFQILSLVTPFITTPYVSRVLGADGIGIYSYSSSVMAYFVMFSVLGTATYATREIARLRDNSPTLSKTFWEIVIIRAICTTICLIGWLILTISSTDYYLYFFALTPMLISTVFDITWFFIGLEMMGYTVMRNTICKVVGIIALFVFVRDRDDLVIYMLLNAVIQLFGMISMWVYVPRLIGKVSFKTLSFRRHINGTINYFVITIAISLYTVLDKVMIGLVTHDNFQNGYYEQANKVIVIAETLAFTALNSVMGSRLSYLFEKNKTDEIKERISRSLDFSFLLVFGLLFGICAVAKNFVPVFFGDGYEPVIKMLYMKSPLLLFISISTILGSHYYIPAGLIKKSTILTIIGSIVNLIANILLIPTFGAEGAIIGTLIGEGLIAVIYFYFAKEYVSLVELIKNTYKRIPAGFLMLFAAYLVQSYVNQNEFVLLILQIVSAGLVYCVCLYLLRDKMFLELTNMVINKIIAYTK